MLKISIFLFVTFLPFRLQAFDEKTTFIEQCVRDIKKEGALYQPLLKGGIKKTLSLKLAKLSSQRKCRKLYDEMMNLTTIVLEHPVYKKANPIQDIEVFRFFPQLHQIELTGHSFGNIQAFENLNDLKTLRVKDHGNNIDWNGLESLYSLEVLKLQNVKFDVADLQKLSQLQNLVHLDLSDNKMDLSYEDLQPFFQLKSLRTLNIKGNHLDKIEAFYPKKIGSEITVLLDELSTAPLQYPGVEYVTTKNILPRPGYKPRQPKPLNWNVGDLPIHLARIERDGQYETLEDRDFAQTAASYEEYAHALLGAVSSCH
ncbi:MAG: hypothetical protein AB8C84_11265 [Oligoflexales bacterium]